MTRLFAGTPFELPVTCDHCGRPESECRCDPDQIAAQQRQRERESKRLPPEKQTARVELEKRKGGRQVTVVRGLTDEANDLPSLFAVLQSACGTGGTVKPGEDVMEFQGNHVDRICAELKTLRYRIR